jgi:hypothetical protein
VTRNPFLNALAAFAYIAGVASFMFFGARIEDAKIGIFAPIAALSLFTLSAGFMAYVFCYQPFVLYFDGKKKQAIDLFLRTLGIFGGVTILLLIIIASGIFQK